MIMSDEPKKLTRPEGGVNINAGGLLSSAEIRVTERALTLTEKLEQVQFIISPQGEKQAAILDLDTWEELLSLARALEPSNEGHFKTVPMEKVPAPKQEDDLTLEELVAQITPENMHGETFTGPPVGDEVW
jgi:hypothetical protein